MNERIKELIKQAADQTSAAFSSSNFRQSEWESDFREKFAELIIHECIKQVEKNFAGAVGTYAGAHNSAVLKCKKSIQEHFGVEE